MSLPVKQKKSRGSTSNSRNTNVINDPRFRNIQTDPRFRLPSRKHNRVQLDQRFARVLQDDEFSRKAQVDRYGRRLPEGLGKQELKRLYHIDETDPKHIPADDDVEKELKRVEGLYDPARQGGFDDSSSSESSSEDGVSNDDDEVENDTKGEVGVGGRLRTQDGDIPLGEVTSRLAAVNMDWDNIRAIDLMAVAQSFCPSGGRIKRVSVLPSEFGRQKMEREETQGPPPELFQKTHKLNQEQRKHSSEPDDAESDLSEEEDAVRIKSKILSQSTADAVEVDTHALRNYQLSRLKYYYAILDCDSETTSLAIYHGMDGSEYLSTANYFDLRFVPDSVTFDHPITDKPRDTCDRVPDGYRPNEFITEALTHSNIRLTWDEDDKNRKEVQKRAFTRDELDEHDLQAYVADGNSSEEDASAQQDDIRSNNSESKKFKATEQRQKMRAALGLSNAPLSGKASTRKQPAGNMQVTFTAGLSPAHEAELKGHPKVSVFANKPSDVQEETTVEKYIRKERERKAKRKAKARAGPEISDSAGTILENDREVEAEISATASQRSSEEDPFADPFFTDPATANARARRDAKLEKRRRAEKEAAADAERKEKERKDLDLLINEDANGIGNTDHFDMAAIRQREKDSKKSRKLKKKKARNMDDEQVLRLQQEGFELNVDDPRFRGVFQNHDFAIDPSHPRFSGTKGMKQLLDEGRRKRKARHDPEPENGVSASVAKRN